MDGMKEKKILIVILAVALMLLPYYYIYKPKQVDNDKVKSEITILQNRYDDLMLKMKMKKSLDEDIEQLNTELNQYNEKFPSHVTQEEMVMLMEYIHNATNIDILNVGLAPFELYYEETNSDDALEDRKETAYSSTVSINYKGSYTEVLDFFEYLRSYSKEVKLSTISMTYNQEQGEFSGDIKISLYIIASGNREPATVPEYPGIIGKDTIISSWANIDAIEGPAISHNKVELFVSLTSSYADMDPVIIGVKGDATGNSEMKVNNTNTSNVTIELSTDDTDYFVEYTIDGNSNGKLKLNVDSTIDIDVYSQKRADEADKTGIITKIINSTNLTTNINVYNDDAETPRFVLESYEGVVNVIKR